MCLPLNLADPMTNTQTNTHCIVNILIKRYKGLYSTNDFFFFLLVAGLRNFACHYCGNLSTPAALIKTRTCWCQSLKNVASFLLLNAQNLFEPYTLIFRTCLNPTLRAKTAMAWVFFSCVPCLLSWFQTT